MRAIAPEYCPFRLHYLSLSKRTLLCVYHHFVFLACLFDGSMNCLAYGIRWDGNFMFHSRWGLLDGASKRRIPVGLAQLAGSTAIWQRWHR